MIKKISYGILALACLYALFTISLWRMNDGFALSHIQSDLSPSPAREVASGDPRGLFNHNFYYLGKGSQCYVFESEDHTLVLKFIRYPRYRLSPLARYFTTPSFVAMIQASRLALKEQKLDALFSSCLLAYEQLREETGLLYLHLNKTSHLNTTVTLYDKLGRAYPISLDDYEFMIQKRGEQIFPYLTRLLAEGKTDEARLALSSLASLLERRAQKGITDHDAVIHKNSGFCGPQALFLDVGSFSPSPNSPNELLSSTRDLQSWLSTHDPALAAHFTQALTPLSASTHNQGSVVPDA